MIGRVEVRGEVGLSRRAVLTGAVSAPVAISLAGCGIRLESDAPDLPGLKTQDPPADRAVLRATLASLQRVLAAADAAPDAASPWLEPVRVAHRAQITRLVDVMAAAGVKAGSAAGSASPSPTPTGTGAASASPSRSTGTASSSATPSSPASSTAPAAEVTALVRAEESSSAHASPATAWASTAANRPMLVSTWAARRAAASLLGSTSSVARGVAPAAVSAVPIARAVRPAVYGFEQIAAKTPVDARTQVRAGLTWLSGARDDLGPVVGEPERPSYSMPVRVTDTASARRLARALLTEVLQALASQIDHVAAQGKGAQEWTLRVWSLAAADLARWGGPVAPFPGLRT